MNLSTLLHLIGCWVDIDNVRKIFKNILLMNHKGNEADTLHK